jgi:hypothetical protein
MAGKFLVLWKLELSRLSADMVRAMLQQQDYGARLLAEGKLEARYHLVGGHGGAWIPPARTGPGVQHRDLRSARAGRDDRSDPDRPAAGVVPDRRLDSAGTVGRFRA